MKLKNAVIASINLSSKSLAIIKVTLGVLVLFAASQLAIPLKPVPITMQTVAVMLIGLTYSKRLGLLSVITYTVLGGMGLPMFQGFEGGLTHLYGPTAGYLFGFIASIYVMIEFRKRFSSQSFWSIFFNCTLGTIVVFIFGIGWLSSIVGFKNAITFGLIPFIIPGVLKALFLSAAVRYIGIIKRSE